MASYSYAPSWASGAVAIERSPSGSRHCFGRLFGMPCRTALKFPFRETTPVRMVSSCWRLYLPDLTASFSIVTASRFQHLVALLPPLQSLHTLLVHLLRHLLISFLLLLGSTSVLDSLYSPLFKMSAFDRLVSSTPSIDSHEPVAHPLSPASSPSQSPSLPQSATPSRHASHNSSDPSLSGKPFSAHATAFHSSGYQLLMRSSSR